jgi:hydroxyacylglutathione hydrolase
MALRVLHADAFEDNYIWVVCPESDNGSNPLPAIIIDPGDAEPVLRLLERERLTPVAILCTHHHPDHVGGVADLVQRFPMPVYGPAEESIAVVDHPLHDGDTVNLDELDLEMQVFAVPGHTRGHIAYYGGGMLFCGDTLFSAGCGRLFEGTAEQMYASLSRLAALDGDTAVYCAHEYTTANLRFARAVEPDNPDVADYSATVDEWRRSGQASLPSTLSRELRVNPFLRAADPAVRRAAESHAGTHLSGEDQVFATLRRWKDGFRG